MVDVLVIGSGGAGMVAALSAKEQGAAVAVLGKSYPTRSQTSMAQGGINAAIGEGDSVEQHIADTLKSAQGLGSEEAIGKLCREGSKRWPGLTGSVFPSRERKRKRSPSVVLAVPLRCAPVMPRTTPV